MGLGTGKEHVIGRGQKFFAMAETVHGTFVKPTATDAVKTQQSSFKVEPSREPIVENTDYREDFEMMTGKSKYSWSWDGQLIPSGTAATECDAGPMLTAACGADNNGGSSKWIYTPSNTQDWPTLSIVRCYSTLWMEAMWGAWVNGMSLKVQGGSAPQLHFEGGAMGYVITGSSTLNGAMVASASMVVATADKNLFGVNSVVQVAALTNTGAGYQITTAAAPPTFTLESAISADTAAVVIPYVPTPTYTGSPIAGIAGSLTIDGAALAITSFELALDNGHEAFEDEALTAAATDFVPGMLKLTGSISVRMRKDYLPYFANPKTFETADIAVVIGSGAGTRFKVDVDAAEFKRPEASLTPDHKAGTVKLDFSALATSGNDSFAITTD